MDSNLVSERGISLFLDTLLDRTPYRSSKAHRWRMAGEIEIGTIEEYSADSLWVARYRSFCSVFPGASGSMQDVRQFVLQSAVQGLLHSNTDAEGVLVAIDTAQLEISRTGLLNDENPQPLVEAVICFLVFSPPEGAILPGTIQTQTESQIGLAVFSLATAVVPRDEIDGIWTDGAWTVGDTRLGQGEHVLFRVTRRCTDRGVLELGGTFREQ